MAVTSVNIYACRGSALRRSAEPRDQSSRHQSTAPITLSVHIRLLAEIGRKRILTATFAISSRRKSTATRPAQSRDLTRRAGVWLFGQSKRSKTINGRKVSRFACPGLSLTSIFPLFHDLHRPPSTYQRLSRTCIASSFSESLFSSGTERVRRTASTSRPLQPLRRWAEAGG
jgi:hypothetical protein